ncbi:hypothetical protein VTO73DRAFT_9639, partial [Trametes versicolor]
LPTSLPTTSSPAAAAAITALLPSAASIVDDEATLVEQFDVQGAGEALLGYDHDGLNEEDEDADDADDDMLDLEDDDAFARFQTKTRVNAVNTFETNRRAGGRKTQKANIKAWNVFIDKALAKGHKLNIQWDINKSWRQARLIFGSSPNTPYNEHNLYNLYCQAFKKAGFESGIKVHPPRHTLGFQQERLGVDSTETSRLGWSQGTYADVYAPALPKKAILACHGYMEHESYAPSRLSIPVPPVFLSRMCPMAEAHASHLDGQANLVGAANHWKMAVALRPHLFLCAAALYEGVPDSPIFRLPALAHDDVKLWMRTEYRSQLAVLDASAGNPISLERLQNTLLRQSLQHLTVKMEAQSTQIVQLQAVITRRTAAFSPPKATITSTSHDTHGNDQGTALDFDTYRPLHVPVVYPSPAELGAPFEWDAATSARIRTFSDTPLFVDAETRAQQDTGVYEAADHSLRAYVAPSPTTPILARPRTQVDLVLPPAAAFSLPGQPVHPPTLGIGSATWETVLQQVKQPKYLWDTWKPSRTLDRMSVQDVWECYNSGEVVRDGDGLPVAIKPPLRLVEQHFVSGWRKGAAARKAWQRFREIPEWVEDNIKTAKLTSTDAIARLEARQYVNGTTTRKGLSALVNELAAERKLIATIHADFTANRT